MRHERVRIPMKIRVSPTKRVNFTDTEGKVVKSVVMNRRLRRKNHIYGERV
jgi:hypothetical protein